ncbi:RIP metalloprotease RseP [Ilyobacter polytropus]|uniref:Zinc metalloprotease n=1 Tax=Ilyobacter polytropus (strain ATCC 51220 / DSM 2926 / LMG 16218 / CuHBu1) TaxID=572544 RepID=E3H8Y6_ILYPC|nr:RIP metalloprotease RseP [Ilyobacter polytropus]ADO83540.1 membrane-associated zinc metalloprotease [Ilyobacter polytropus DSM 2926]
MNVLITIIILGIIIFIHELGHFMAAKFFKMPVSEFSIGMGPKLYSYEGIETTYSVRAIPVGGFVNIEGMEVDSEVEDGFNTKSPFSRFIVLFAGVFMNFSLALVIIYFMVVSTGKMIQSEEAVIGGIMETSNAYELILEGDRIFEINDREIVDWDDISTIIKEEAGETPLKIEVIRDGEEKSFLVEPIYEPGRDQPLLGILPEYSVEKYGIIESFKVAGGVFKDLFIQIISGLKLLVTGRVKADDITGPVGMIKVVGEASKGGASLLVWLTALLSVNIGIFNLLPFPALDGGRIVFVVLELIGVTVNKKLEERLHMAGMIVLIGLILFITMNDVFNLISN